MERWETLYARVNRYVFAPLGAMRNESLSARYELTQDSILNFVRRN